METRKNILIAFILNLSFSVFELIGGLLCGSVAILSDSLHDIGDATSIGLSYFLEKKSTRPPNDRYTYGYGRFSLLGGLITTCILLFGSVAVIISAVGRILTPVKINYDQMIVFAIVGVIVNLLAAFFTRHGHSVNQRAVSLHMLEDVLGWIVVLVGSVVMKFTDFYLIDPIMSIGVAIFIFISAVKNLLEILDVFLLKVPKGVDFDDTLTHLLEIDGVLGVHHLHLWSIDGNNTCATVHILAETDALSVKNAVRKELFEYGITCATIEFENSCEHCDHKECLHLPCEHHGHHHHH